MKSELYERDDFALMPRMSTAVVCLEPDCEVIYPRTLERCPGCGAQGNHPIKNWIQRRGLAWLPYGEADPFERPGYLAAVEMPLTTECACSED